MSDVSICIYKQAIMQDEGPGNDCLTDVLRVRCEDLNITNL